MRNPTGRFTERAGAYVRSRPGYPDAVFEELKRAGLREGGVVADIGAGTGISTRLLERHGWRAVGVEPNQAMRAEALRQGLDVREGTGEATGLDAGSVDGVLCAQAFHWLRQEDAWREFVRITKPGGVIGLVWNQRVRRGTAFVEGLEELLRSRSEEYARHDDFRAERSEERLRGLAAPRELHVFECGHEQRFDEAGLLERLRSASFVPLEDEEFPALVERLFEATNEGGLVAMPYECRLYWARV